MLSWIGLDGRWPVTEWLAWMHASNQERKEGKKKEHVLFLIYAVVRNLLSLCM